MVIRLKYSEYEDDDYRLPVMFWYYSSNSKPFLTAIKKQTAEFLFHLWPKKNNCFYLSVIYENLEMGSNIKKADSFL